MVCPHLGYRSATPLGTKVSLSRVNRGVAIQSVRANYKTRLGGGRNLTAVEGNASVYQVYPAPASSTS